MASNIADPKMEKRMRYATNVMKFLGTNEVVYSLFRGRHGRKTTHEYFVPWKDDHGKLHIQNITVMLAMATDCPLTDSGIDRDTLMADYAIDPVHELSRMIHNEIGIFRVERL
jgi:hypothetical protein